MNDLYAKLGLETPKTLPECPEAAIVIAGMFLRLGASLIIDNDGARRMILPEPCSFRMDGRDLPEPVPNAMPHEAFLNDEQYRGALRMVTGMMSRLHPRDAAFVYDAFAHVSVRAIPQEA